MAVTPWNRPIDLAASGAQEIGVKRIVRGEAKAHTWRVTLTDGGLGVDLTGYSALISFVRPVDKATVEIAATITGNVIEGTLTQPCALYQGWALALMWIINASTGVQKVVDALSVEIAEGATDDIADTGLVPTLNELLALIESMQTAEAGRVSAEEIRAAFYAGYNSKLDAIPNWRKTTGNPARFYPVPASALAVKVLLTATQAGSGDPSPSNIRAISPAVAAGGTVGVRCSGKNITNAAGGSYHAQTNIVELTNVRPGMMISAQIYINNTAKTLATAALAVQQRQDSTLLGSVYGNSIAIGASGISKAENIPILANANKVTLVYTQSVTDSADSVVSQVQVEYGATATAYEAYSATDYTLTAVGNLYGLPGAEDTKANDGSEVYNKSIVSFTGTESWEYSSSSLPTDTSFTRFYLARSGVAASPFGKSSHFPFAAVGGSGVAAECITGYSSGNRLYAYILKSRLTGWDDAWTNAQKIAAFKAWLAAQVTAETPVQVLYQLAAPTTATGSSVSIPALSALDKYAERMNVVTLDKGTSEVGFAEHPNRNSAYLAEKTGYGVISGLTVAAQSTPDLTVKVAPGIVYTPTGDRYSLLGAASLAVNAANATNPRVDIVYVSAVGIITYLAGTAAATPSAPALPTGGVLLAEIAVAAGATSITAANITARKKTMLSEDWITPTLLNSATGTIRYRKVADVLVEVYFSITVGTGASSTILAQMAAGYRPSYYLISRVRNGTTGGISDVAVDGSGNISLAGAVTTGNIITGNIVFAIA